MLGRAEGMFMRRQRKPRQIPEPLSGSVQQKLSCYALAAGAGLFTLAPMSEAKIVYTPVNESIGRGGTLPIDLNNDGIVDFEIIEHPGQTQFRTSQFVDAKATVFGNQVKCVTSSCISTFIYAAALRSGTAIGPNRGWLGGLAPMAFEELFKRGSLGYTFAWVNVTDRYLGLKFKINGETHFGWARLNVKFHPGLRKDRTWEVQLTGYAYETVANKPIVAGMTKGPEEQTSFSSPSKSAKDASLASLAYGVAGLALWRRENFQ
jgi:hypothetical protein